MSAPHKKQHRLPVSREVTREKTATAAQRAVRGKRSEAETRKHVCHCPGCFSGDVAATHVEARPSMIRPESFLVRSHCLNCGLSWEESFKPADIKTF